MPPPILTQLVNLQKNFLWNSTLKTSGTRHKINAALAYAPKEAGGLGLMDIALAVKIQRAKHMVQWPTETDDGYTAAWHVLQHPSRPYSKGCCDIAPCNPSKRRGTIRTAREEAQRWLREDIYQMFPIPEQRTSRIADVWTLLRQDAQLDQLDRDRFQIKLPRYVENKPPDCDDIQRLYWTNYRWHDNDWISAGPQLPMTQKQFPFIQACRIDQIELQRIEPEAFKLRVPIKGKVSLRRWTKLIDWCICIILCTPHLEVSTSLTVPYATQLWNPPKLMYRYSWIIMDSSCIIGSTVHEGEFGVLECIKQHNGFTWSITSLIQPEWLHQGLQNLQRTASRRQLIFKANPRIMKIPWKLTETGQPQTVTRQLNKARARRIWSPRKRLLQPIIEQLEAKVSRDTWIAECLDQTPRKLWASHNSMTRYQVWFNYRMSTGQWNLYYQGRKFDSTCKADPSCKDLKETIAHIAWECSHAQAIWQQAWTH